MLRGVDMFYDHVEMTQEHKDFILNELIPFIQRDHGNGFAMEIWLGESEHLLRNLPDQDRLRFADRPLPACGTVCCIGGSIDYLMCKKMFPPDSFGLNDVNQMLTEISTQDTARFIGLDFRKGHDLFFEKDWPPAYKKRFAEAKNPQEQADIACDLLREVVETNGKVLAGQYGTKA